MIDRDIAASELPARRRHAPENDERPDGRHLEWRDQVAWRLLDHELRTGLAALSERSIAVLEQAAYWPKRPLFHREPMPLRVERSTWGARMRSILDGADIVFLDPDNGVGGETEKHATFSEIRLLRKPGRAIVFITVPSRSMTRDTLLQQLHGRLMVELLNEGRGGPPLLTALTTVSGWYTGYPNSASPVILMHSHVIRPTMISDSVTSGHTS